MAIDYYVSKHGAASNLNFGGNLTDDAWATIDFGFANVGSTNRLNIGTGAYDVARPSIRTDIANGTAGNHTTISDAGDGTVTLQHPNTSNRFGIINFSTGNPAFYISFIGTSPGSLVFDGENQSNCGSLLYFAQGTTQNNHHLLVKNCELKRVVASGVLGGHSDGITFDTCEFHDIGSHSVNNVPQDHGIYCSGPNLIVRYSTFYNIYGHCIQTSSESPSAYLGREIYGNTLYNSGYGAGTEIASAIIFEEGGGTIYNNLIYGISGSGIECWRGNGVTIYHNTVYGCLRYGIQVGFSGTNAFDCLVKNNIAIGNASGDMRVTTATNTVVEWNTFGSGSIINTGTNTTNANNYWNASAAIEFVSAVGGNFHLQDGAVSRNPAGIVGVGITTDIEGTTRSFIDKGCYAFGGAVTQTFNTRQRKQSATGASPRVLTFDNTPLDGNLLQVFAMDRSGSTEVPTISGSGWTQRVAKITEIADANAQRALYIWSKQVSGGSEPTEITVTWADATEMRVLIGEWQPTIAVPTIAFVEAISADSGTGSTSPLGTGNSSSLSESDYLIFLFAGWRCQGVSGNLTPAVPVWTSIGGQNFIPSDITDGIGFSYAQQAYSALSGVQSNSAAWVGSGHEATVAMLVYSLDPEAPPPPVLGPTITHEPSFIVTTQYGPTLVTLAEGDEGIVQCTISSAGSRAPLRVSNANVTVALA